LAAKHCIHQTMIAIWKRQDIEGMAVTFSIKSEAASAASEAETARLHAIETGFGHPDGGVTGTGR
jgi:transposase